MASSTTNPVATVSAMSDRLLMLKWHRYITPKVPIKETGTTTLGIRVARPSRKNKNTTRMTRATEIARVRSTSDNDPRIVGVRSNTTFISIAAGMEALNWGIKAVTRSTVSIILALGCRLIISRMARLPLAIPKLRTSCTESVTSATSDKRTGAPLFQDTIKLR